MSSSALSITMHELRRPLTLLSSYGQMLATGMLSERPESSKIAVDGILESTEMMPQMVSVLGELSRLEDSDSELRMEPLNVAEITGSAVRQVRGHPPSLRKVLSLCGRAQAQSPGCGAGLICCQARCRTASRLCRRPF